MNAGARVEIVPYGGWAKNYRLSNGTVELVVTLEVGPRIIRYGRVGGRNLLGEIAHEMGRSGEPRWQLRGGHRLWVAPEDPEVTYGLDNTPVEHAAEGGRLRATTPADARFGLERTMEVVLADRGSRVEVLHRVRNLGRQTLTVAPWPITLFAPGGTAVIPLPPGRPHPGAAARSVADFAPHLSLALWPYFRFDDPRLTLGRSWIRLRQDPGASGPIKLGLALPAGWAGYFLDGELFVKRFPYQPGAVYPDRGCNFETYTDERFLELESLAPLVSLAPGGETSHIERWSLLSDLPSPQDEETLDRHFFPRISSHDEIEIG